MYLWLGDKLMYDLIYLLFWIMLGCVDNRNRFLNYFGYGRNIFLMNVFSENIKLNLGR